MTPAAYALLEGLVDYAGLFPPADLDLAPALDRYRQHRAGGEAWMLGPFIVPVGQLGAIEAIRSEQPDSPLSLSVLVGPPASDTGDAWLTAATDALGETRAWRQRGTVQAEAFEARVPASLAHDADALADALGAFEAAARDSARPIRLAVEVPFLTDPAAAGPMAQAVADANGRAERPAFALKLRCGGVTPDLVPSVDQLAAAIDAALQSGAPFKATAGLHHPLPNHDEAVGARMHGFLGVFGGATLARLHGLGRDDLAEILDDADPDAWSVDDGLRWRSLRASAAEVADARAQAALSFGSCSFDEPRDDLRALGWL